MNILTELPPEAKKGQLVSMDFETFNQTPGKLHRPNGTFACISIALEGDPNVYQLYDSHDLRKLVRAVADGTWVFHHALYDLRQFQRYATVKPRFIWDTMLVDQAMQGGLYQTFGLADLSRRWLQLPMEKDTREDFFGLPKPFTPAMKKYAALDAVRTLEIAQKQRAAYEHDSGMRAYYMVDEPMIFPVLDLQGFRVDVKGWEEMVRGFETTAHVIEEELDLNVFAWAKVKDRLAKRGIHVPDTKNETLEEYIEDPYVAKIIEGRLYRTATSRYGMKWLEENVESDGKVYSDWSITGALTGRMASSDPNMQNIPARKLPIYRSRFLASDNQHVVEVWDAKQQEPCITAYHSQDALLLDALERGESTHATVAKELYDDLTITKESDPEKYGDGKIINLGLTYGLTPKGVARKTGKSLPEAEKLVRKYFQRFSGVFSWIQDQRRTAFEQGFVTTALGRRAYVNPYDYKWENNAINSPIQGGGADFTKTWCRKTWELKRKAGLPHTTIGLIHDEQVFDTPKEILRESQPLVREAFFESAARLYPGVHFDVEMEMGTSWGAKAVQAERITIGEEE